MRMTARGIALGGLCLVAVACQQKPAAETALPTSPAPAATPVAAAPTALPPPAAEIPPEMLAVVTQTLAAAQAFNAKSAEDLAAVTKADRRIHELAVQAADAAAKSSGVMENDRLKLAQRVAAARTEAEAAHADLGPRQAAFRVAAQAQTDAVAAAQLQCAATPEFAASEPCVNLPAEQAKLAQSITALTTKFAAAEATYVKDRPRLEEASAIMALGSR